MTNYYTSSSQRIITPNASTPGLGNPYSTSSQNVPVQTRRIGPYTNLLIRLIFLGVIVYLVVSYVPTTPLMFETKLLISLLVVVTYSVFDLIGVTLSTFKYQACRIFC